MKTHGPARCAATMSALVLVCLTVSGAPSPAQASAKAPLPHPLAYGATWVDTVNEQLWVSINWSAPGSEPYQQPTGYRIDVYPQGPGGAPVSYLAAPPKLPPHTISPWSQMVDARIPEVTPGNCAYAMVSPYNASGIDAPVKAISKLAPGHFEDCGSYDSRLSAGGYDSNEVAVPLPKALVARSNHPGVVTISTPLALHDSVLVVHTTYRGKAVVAGTVRVSGMCTGKVSTSTAAGKAALRRGAALTLTRGRRTVGRVKIS